MDLTYARGYTYALSYTLIWKTFKKKNLLTRDVCQRLETLLNDIAHNNNFEINHINILDNAVILKVTCSPQNYIPDMLKALKGNSARTLLSEFPMIKEQLEKGKLWDANYCILTEGAGTQLLLEDYLNR